MNSSINPNTADNFSSLIDRESESFHCFVQEEEEEEEEEDKTLRRIQNRKKKKRIAEYYLFVPLQL